MCPLTHVGIAVADLQGLLPGLQSLAGVAELVLDVTAAEPDESGFGQQLLQVPQVRTGLRVAFLGGGDQGQSLLGIRVIGPGLQGGLKTLVGIIVIAEAVQDAAEIHQQVGVARR